MLLVTLSYFSCYVRRNEFLALKSCLEKLCLSSVHRSQSHYCGGVGRGRGVGRGLGVALGVPLGVGVTVGDPVGVGLAVALGVGVGVGP